MSDVAGFTATHVAPDGGMQAWDAPDPARPPVAEVQAGVRMQVVERRGAWARVLFSNGWSGWVDGRRLVPTAPPPPAPGPPPQPQYEGAYGGAQPTTAASPWRDQPDSAAATPRPTIQGRPAASPMPSPAQAQDRPAVTQAPAAAQAQSQDRPAATPGQSQNRPAAAPSPDRPSPDRPSPDRPAQAQAQPQPQAQPQAQDRPTQQWDQRWADDSTWAAAPQRPQAPANPAARPGPSPTAAGRGGPGGGRIDESRTRSEHAVAAWMEGLRRFNVTPAPIGAALVLIGSVLSWIRIAGAKGSAFKVPIKFLVDYKTESGSGIKVGLLLLAIAIVAGVFCILPGQVTIRRVLGGVAIAIALLYTLQLQRALSAAGKGAPSLFSALGFGVIIVLLGAIALVVDASEPPTG